MTRFETGRATPFVDGMGVQLWLLRNTLADLRTAMGLRPVTVLTNINDELSNYIPLVKIQRTGGASDNPRFTSQFWMNYQVWSDVEPASDEHDRPEWDARQATFELGNQVARVLFIAQESQIVTPFGAINKWRESTGFRQFDDPDLPHISRQVATYDLMIRNLRTPRT